MPDPFRASIDWTDPKPEGPSDRATHGRAILEINGRPIWGTPGAGIEWSWSDLLEWLAANWKHLLFETGNPLDLELLNPFLLRRTAEQEWKIGMKTGTMSEETYLGQEEAVYEYELRHDLSHAVKGVTVPSVFIAREDAGFTIASIGELARIDNATFVQKLKALGDTIAGRLRPIADDVAQSLVHDWDQRSPQPSSRLVSLNTTLSPENIDQIAAGRTLEETWELANDSFEENELLAAARMAAGRLSPVSIASVLDVVRHQPYRSTPHLNTLAEKASAYLAANVTFEDAHRQGRRLAQWLRTQSGIVSWEDGHAVVHPNQVLDAWKIEVVEVSLAEPTLEGIGAWGPKHGPVILVNVRSARANRPTARRSILSHEICHLLVDRNDALPLAEVIDGRIQPNVERRARAFGAELLLPVEIIARTYHRDESVPDWVDFLSQTYGASYETCAWQIRNCIQVLTELSDDDRAYLRSLVHEPDRF